MTGSPMLSLGVVGRPHGVRGELVFRPYNPDGLRLEELTLPLDVELVRADRRERRQVIAARPFQDASLIRFAAVESREAAAALVNAELHVPRELLPPLEEGELYIEDLVGCAVVDQHGRERGTVRGSFWNGGHDVLTIVDERGVETLIPLVPEFVTDVDWDARRVVIDDHE